MVFRLVYLRGAQDCRDWRFAPLQAADHRGVAPAWIAVTGCDPLRDEGLAYAALLSQAAVPVDVTLWRGVTHDFIKLSRVLPEAERAVDAAAQALRAAARHSGVVSA